MTRISACDGRYLSMAQQRRAWEGRYLSMAQQRRAWEELNRIFGGTTPPPPGPDPPGPGGDGNVLYYRQGYYIQDIMADPAFENRITQRQIQTSSGPVLVPFFELDGSGNEVVVLFTYVLDGDIDPLEQMLLSYGVFTGPEEFRSEELSLITWVSSWPQDFLMVEVFYCDGEQYVYYQNNLDFSDGRDPVQPALNVDRFGYSPSAGEKPGICFYGATAERVSGEEGFLGAMIVSMKEEVK